MMVMSFAAASKNMFKDIISTKAVLEAIFDVQEEPEFIPLSPLAAAWPSILRRTRMFSITMLWSFCIVSAVLLVPFKVRYKRLQSICYVFFYLLLNLHRLYSFGLIIGSTSAQAFVINKGHTLLHGLSAQNMQDLATSCEKTNGDLPRALLELAATKGVDMKNDFFLTNLDDASITLRHASLTIYPLTRSLPVHCALLANDALLCNDEESIRLVDKFAQRIIERTTCSNYATTFRYTREGFTDNASMLMRMSNFNSITTLVLDIVDDLLFK